MGLYNLYDLGMRLYNLYDLGMRLYNLYDLGMRLYITSGGLTRPVWGTRLPLRIILATMAAGLPTAWAIAVNPLGVPYIVRLMCLVSCGKQMWPTYTHNRVYRESCDQPRVLRWLGTAKFVKVYNHVARFSCFRGTSSSLAFKVLLHPYILTLGRSAPPGAEKALRLILSLFYSFQDKPQINDVFAERVKNNSTVKIWNPAGIRTQDLFKY